MIIISRCIFDLQTQLTDAANEARSIKSGSYKNVNDAKVSLFVCLLGFNVAVTYEVITPCVAM